MSTCLEYIISHSKPVGTLHNPFSFTYHSTLKPHNIIDVEGKQNKQGTLSYPEKGGSTQSDYKERVSMGLAGIEPATSAV